MLEDRNMKSDWLESRGNIISNLSGVEVSTGVAQGFPMPQAQAGVHCTK